MARLYFSLLFIYGLLVLSQGSISYRKGRRILYDSPSEPFGLDATDRTGFALAERAVCTVKAVPDSKTAEETEKTDGRIRSLDDADDDWSRTILKSYIQTYRGIPFYSSSLVLSFDPTTGKYERRDNHGLKHVDPVEAESLFMVPKIAPEECLFLCKKNFDEVRPSESVKYQDYFYIDEADKFKLKFVKKVVFRPIGHVDLACLVEAVQPGQVLHSWTEGNSVTKSVNGTGGNTKTGQYTYGVEKPLLTVRDLQDPAGTCQLNHSQIAVYGSCLSTTPTTFTCAKGTTDKTDESFSPLNDCYFAADKFQDFITNAIGLSPWFDDSISSFIKVYVQTAGECSLPLTSANKCSTCSLACFYPNTNTLVANNGCGQSSNYYHICTCADVIGHEFGHAITAKYSELLFGAGNSGIPDPRIDALARPFTEAACVNEAFSDIIGIAFEYWLGPGTDYLIGEKCTKGSKPIRSLINAADSLSPGIDNMFSYSLGYDAHLCAGIFGKAFYTLANTPGWNPVKAAKPFALANQCYWRQAITMREAACSVVNAGTTLFGSSARGDITSAFAAVGIDKLCQTTTAVPLENCQTATVDYTTVRVGDLANFRYVVPAPLDGQPNAYLLVHSIPKDWVTIWNTGDTAPNFDSNENLYLRGDGPDSSYYYASNAPSGIITFAIYAKNTPTETLALNVCGDLAEVNTGPLSISTTDGSTASCAPSLTGLSWTITRVPSIFVAKVTIPTSAFLHFTYKFSMTIKSPPADSNLLSSLRVRLYLGKGYISIDESSPFASLDETKSYTATDLVMAKSSTPNFADDYYLTLTGYIDSSTYTEAFMDGIQMTFCQVTDANNFNGGFNFSINFPIISGAQPRFGRLSSPGYLIVMTAIWLTFLRWLR